MAANRIASLVPIRLRQRLTARGAHAAGRTTRYGTLLVGCAVAHFALAQSPGEQAFAGARKWTVQIRGSVSRPFIEDQIGSYYGAGLVVDAKRGWILTNAHVASHSYATLGVAFADLKPIRAERVYVDPHLDLAVVAYDPKALATQPAVPELDCEAVPPVGHPVGAFGHPWGFRFTGTRGITSAVTSRLGPTMLQTDAPINEGNSGGPLISLETGKVVGVNAAKVSEEEVEGLSFAVPMPYACTILHLLENDQDPSPPDRLVDFAVDEYGDQTLIVARSRLAAGSLALRVGDQVIAVGRPEQTVANETDLADALRGKLGDVALFVRRGDAIVKVTGSWPPAARILERRGLMVAGALFADAEPMTRGHLAQEYALMVHHIEPGSDAEAAAIQQFDLLVSVDHQPVGSLEALYAAIERARKENRPLQVTLLEFASEAVTELFVYQQRVLPAEDVEWVTPDSNAARRAARAKP